MVRTSTLLTVTILVVTTLTSGCALTAVSLTTTVTTGKSLNDHTASQITGYDCNTVKWITDNTHSYYCEIPRTASNSYVHDVFGR
jgi:hypothetical protein